MQSVYVEEENRKIRRSVVEGLREKLVVANRDVFEVDPLTIDWRTFKKWFLEEKKNVDKILIITKL